MHEPTIIIRLDADSSIGSGHLMRCMSIANELKKLDAKVIFAVSHEESADHIREKGQQAFVLEGDVHAFTNKDAELLATFAKEHEATALLIDTYAVSPAFFSKLQDDLPETISVFYIDDEYLFSEGKLDKPYIYPVDGLINYGFNADEKLYDELYGDATTSLLLGPEFAPVRPQFLFEERPTQQKVKRVLITTGSTNPNGTLEKMIEACEAFSDQIIVDVVLGPLATFEHKEVFPIEMHVGSNDLSSLMKQADVAISAAGTTLYELCAAALPTIAVPIVENQLANIEGLKKRNLALTIADLDFETEDIARELCKIVNSKNLRYFYSENMKKAVDGRGAYRIAKALCGKYRAVSIHKKM